MPNILLTIYFCLVEPITSIVEILNNQGQNIYTFPVLKHRNDPKCLDLLLESLEKNKIDKILWWCISVPCDYIKKIADLYPNIDQLYFNWDDPHNWPHEDIANKAKYFKTVFSCCEGSLQKYPCQAIFLLPGYHSKYHSPCQLPYKCDISFCCTNLYDDENMYPNQYINRKLLVDQIYQNQERYSYVFHIYGPTWLKTRYQKSYQGNARYEDTGKIFNSSKINLCTHVQKNSYKYVNERSILIIGSGGLLLVDKVDGLDQLFNNNECVFLDFDNYIEQIVEILGNYDQYISIKDNGYQKSLDYTWEKWAQTICSNL